MFFSHDERERVRQHNKFRYNLKFEQYENRPFSRTIYFRAP